MSKKTKYIPETAAEIVKLLHTNPRLIPFTIPDSVVTIDDLMQWTAMYPIVFTPSDDPKKQADARLYYHHPVMSALDTLHLINSARHLLANYDKYFTIDPEEARARVNRKK